MRVRQLHPKRAVILCRKFQGQSLRIPQSDIEIQKIQQKTIYFAHNSENESVLDFIFPSVVGASRHGSCSFGKAEFHREISPLRKKFKKVQNN